mgnify:CR=1 FL=1
MKIFIETVPTETSNVTVNNKTKLTVFYQDIDKGSEN